MSLMKEVSRGLWLAGMTMAMFFLFAPAYYTILDTMYALALAEGDPTLNAFVYWIYQMFYWGYPSLVVFALLMIVLGMFNRLRRKYYATEEVTRYGS